MYEFKFRKEIRRQYGRVGFLTRESGGYATSDAAIRTAIREIVVTLSPGDAAKSTSAEQLFTQPTLEVLSTDRLAYVNKPAAQAGLAVVASRISSTGAIGIVFGNFTTTSITPTASEAYTLGIASPRP